MEKEITEVVIKKDKTEYVKRLKAYELSNGRFQFNYYVEVGFDSGNVITVREDEAIFEE